MSILINMKMPKNCLTCPCTDSEYGECVLDPEKRCPKDYGQRAEWCPLAPVPPHGRLIDVDYADEYAYDELEVANNYLTGWEAARAMQKIYQNAPTIIPAEEGE